MRSGARVRGRRGTRQPLCTFNTPNAAPESIRMDPATSRSQSSEAVNFVTLFPAGSTNLWRFTAEGLRGALIVAVLSALLNTARPAQAQSMNVLYNFPPNSLDDGAGPITGL